MGAAFLPSKLSDSLLKGLRAIRVSQFWHPFTVFLRSVHSIIKANEAGLRTEGAIPVLDHYSFMKHKSINAYPGENACRWCRRWLQIREKRVAGVTSQLHLAGDVFPARRLRLRFKQLFPLF